MRFVALLFIPALLAQQPRVSPHQQVALTIEGKKITIDYGRPYMKGRKIFGGLVPYGQVWRTGADEATVLTTGADLQIGTLKVPKGSYSLFTVPGEDKWQLVVNKTAKQWGAFSYKQADDLGRTDMKAAKVAAPAEQFTITLDEDGPRKAVLKMAWDTVVASVPISVLP